MSPVCQIFIIVMPPYIQIYIMVKKIILNNNNFERNSILLVFLTLHLDPKMLWCFTYTTFVGLKKEKWKERKKLGMG